MPTKPGDNTSMGEKAKRVPPLPRARFGSVTLLPQMDDDWHPIKDRWVLPGRAVVTSDELRALATARGVTVLFQLPQEATA